MKVGKIKFSTLVLILGAYLLIELSVLWKGHSDLAVSLVGNPYGLFWTWINPFYLNDVLYKVYLTGFIIGMVALQIFLYRRGKFSFIVILLNQFTNFFWLYVTGFQHITMTAWQALAFYNPAFMLLWGFSEFPIGNSFGVTCDFGSKVSGYTYNGVFYLVCGGPGVLFGGGGSVGAAQQLGIITWHLIDIAWLIGPMIYWAWKWKVWKWPRRAWTWTKRN